MYKITRTFLAVLFVLAITSGVNAQDKVIHGVVTTFDSIAVIGAEVKVKSTDQVVQTDTLGRFSVGVNKNDQLKIKAKGFFNQKVNLEDKTKIVAVNLKLKPGEKNKELAIGYGYVSDRNKLNAISSLENDELDFSRYNNIYELIKGRFAGVQVINNQIIIRGINSINSGVEALIVLDGMTVDGSYLNAIPPSQVKSINVIKDGGAAIYGSRGANGVVIIETKKGGD